MHNNLRITRILKSLGELGFEHFQAPLVRFFLEETLVKKTLSSVKRSVLDYFLFAVRDKRERRKLIRYAFQHFEPKDKFVWCPRKIQKRFKKKSEKRQNSIVTNGESVSNDEANVQHKTKEGETTGEQKSKPADVIETTPHVEDDSGMNVDSEKQAECTLEDLEKANLDGSSVNVPLNNGTNMDNGEIDHSKPSSVEEQCGVDDKIDLTEVLEVPKQILELESDQKASEKKLECAAGSSTGSAECIESLDEMGSLICPTTYQLDQKELHEAALDANQESTVTDSPEKILMPDFKNRSGVSALKETSAEIMNVRSVKNHDYNNINCNQSNIPDKEEPMDIVDLTVNDS